MIMMISSDVQLLVESSIDEIMTTTMNSEYCSEYLSILRLWDYQEVSSNYTSIIGVNELFYTANMRLL